MCDPSGPLYKCVLSLFVLAKGTLKFLFRLKLDSQLLRGGKSSCSLWSVAVLALRINMRKARCETPGMRIPLLGRYRSGKRLADLWLEYSLSSVF